MVAEWLRRLSLRARLTLVASILVAGALAAGAILLSGAVDRALVTSVDDAARLRAQEVALLIDTGRLPNPIPVEAGTPLVQVVDADDRVLAASPGGDQLVPILLPEDVRAVRAGESRTVPGSRLGQEDDLHVVGESAGDGGTQTVLVAMSLADVRGALRVVRTVLFGGAPLLIGAFAAACWLLVGQALRPVGALRRGAEEITSTREARRLPVPAADDEVHRLAVTLNDMLDRLERSSAKQRAFVSDAAHELRSPLTAIRAQLEVAQAHPERADWQQTSADALADVERLSRLVDDLLILARIDEVPERRMERVDLAQLADDLVERYEVVPASPAESRPAVAVRRTGAESAYVEGDVDGLSRIVANLIDNAVVHADSVVTVDVRQFDGGRPVGAGGLTDVGMAGAGMAGAGMAGAGMDNAARQGDASVELIVSDDGPGIPAEDRERVFDRFTRLDIGRSRDAGGTGLGLPIVRELVRAHGGSVALDDNDPGLRAVVHLPAPPPLDHEGLPACEACEAGKPS